MKKNSTTKIISLGQSGVRISLFSLLALVAVFILYGYVISPSDYPSSSVVSRSATHLAIGVFIILFMSILGIAYGLYNIGASEKTRFISLSAGSQKMPSIVFVIVHIISQRKYRRVFFIACLSYGLFFSLVSQIIIIRPDISFSELYQISIPSVKITTCCSLPGFVPILSAYLLDNLIILVIPINILLVVIISFLVGVNLSMTLYLLDHRSIFYKRDKRVSCLGGLGGAMSGLFTACPICAGTLFSTLLGIVMGLSSASAITLTVLMPFQALFIAVSIPLLIFSSYISAKTIVNSYGQLVDVDN